MSYQYNVSVSSTIIDRFDLIVDLRYKPCPAGWYTDAEGTQCTQCPLGRYSASADEKTEAACISCEAGTYPGGDVAQTGCTSPV